MGWIIVDVVDGVDGPIMDHGDIMGMSGLRRRPMNNPCSRGNSLVDPSEGYATTERKIDEVETGLI